MFGDGSHSQLYPLTKRRSEAALPIAGNYRLVDAVVSNCINSNITKIYALTQFNSTSLNSHLSRAYSSARFGKDGGFVEVVAAYQSPEGKGWFQVLTFSSFSTITHTYIWSWFMNVFSSAHSTLNHPYIYLGNCWCYKKMFVDTRRVSVFRASGSSWIPSLQNGLPETDWGSQKQPCWYHSCCL